MVVTAGGALALAHCRTASSLQNTGSSRLQAAVVLLVLSFLLQGITQPGESAGVATTHELQPLLMTRIRCPLGLC